MEVLFKSIDVRDLLSSHDLDDSSPLSAPDLRLLIDRLQVRSLHIKSKVQHYILSHHDDFYSLFSQCSDAVSRSENISVQVTDLLRLISDHPIDAEIRDVIGEISTKRKEAKEKKELLELMKLILELTEKLKFTKEELRAGRVVEAAEAVRELKAELRIRDNAGEEEEGREPVVFRLLRKEWMECFEEIQEVLVRFMENAVTFDQNSNAVRVKYQSSVNRTDGVELRTILKAMVDKEDDLKVGVKSTALQFGDSTKEWVGGFGIVCISSLALSGFNADIGWPYYVFLAAASGQLAWQIWMVDISSRADCNRKFVSNKWFGAIVFSGILFGRLVMSYRKRRIRSKDSQQFWGSEVGYFLLNVKELLILNQL